MTRSPGSQGIAQSPEGHSEEMRSEHGKEVLEEAGLLRPAPTSLSDKSFEY